MRSKRFVESKSATGIDRPSPRTGKPQQTPADWTVATRGKGGGPVPSIAEIRGFRHIHFVLDGEAPPLRAAGLAELANLRASNPGWTFTAELGVKIFVPPAPDTGQPDESPMSIAVLITYRDLAAPGPTYLPLATEAVFADEWLPAAAKLGCVWIPLFQTGAPVPLQDLPAVLGELAWLRDHFASLPGVSEGVRERSRWLVDELERIDPASIRELFIG